MDAEDCQVTHVQADVAPLGESARVLTRLVDEVFRSNAAFVAEGDALAAAVGLSAARWRVLGQLAKESLTAAEIARQRGLRRQSVQESVQRLESDGLVARIPNAADRRAPLVVLTDEGRAALMRIEPERKEWANRRSAEVSLERLQTSLEVLQELRLGAGDLG